MVDFTPEVRAKLRAARLGKRLSDSAKAKISRKAILRANRKKGIQLGLIEPAKPKGKRVLSAEHKAAISASMTGKPKTAEHKAMIAWGVKNAWEGKRCL